MEKLEKGYTLAFIIRELKIPRSSYYITKYIINESPTEQ
jgi:hypothetical protein